MFRIISSPNNTVKNLGNIVHKNISNLVHFYFSINKKVQISFEENERELKLYDYVMAESDKSCFVKKAIECFLKCKSLGSEFRCHYKDEIDI